MKQKRSAFDIQEKEAEWQKARRQNPIINRRITEIKKECKEYEGHTCTKIWKWSGKEKSAKISYTKS